MGIAADLGGNRVGKESCAVDNYWTHLGLGGIKGQPSVFMTNPNMPPEMLVAAAMHLIALRQKLDVLYALEADGSAGFFLLSDRMKKIDLEQSKVDGLTPEQRTVFYGNGDPSAEGATYLHRTTIAQIADRNRKGGRHEQMLRNAIIVLAYMYWEDKTREKFARELNLKKDDIRSEIYGDLRHYRHAIAHNDGTLAQATKVLKYVNVGDQVNLNSDQFRDLLTKLIDELDFLSMKFLNISGLFTFAQKLNQ